MIWKNVELFNVAETTIREDGSLSMYRFPTPAREAFSHSLSKGAVDVGNMTTGCELRFVGKEADIFLSAEECEGSIEIYRGDFLCRVERLQVGDVKRITLKHDLQMDIYPIPPQPRFSPNVWRIIFDHDFRVVLHDIQGEVRPPQKGEVPNRKILAYGSSITHSAGAQLFTNSYIYNVGKRLGVDVLCKGMGGSCHIEKETADYLCKEEWDVAILELGINMIGVYSVSAFEEKARYLIEKMAKQGKPVVLISNFTSFYDFSIDIYHQTNEDYVACLKKLYSELNSGNLYYIQGQEIVTEWDYLMTDLLHPSPYAHFEMGRKIAQKIREEFKIL